jgi:ABC-type microcin C transport system permease subunit YejB
MTFGQSVISILVGVILVFFFGTVAYYLFYRLPQAMGITAWFRMRKLKKKFKGYGFEDGILRLCEIAVNRGWRYRDMLQLTKGSSKRDEILYTYILYRKIKGISSVNVEGDKKFNSEIADDIAKGVK